MSALKPIGHEDRLSLVEHLDELRTRLILCIGVLVLAFSLCYWQNERILDIVNRPLEKAQHVTCDAQKQDPLERSACFDRALGAYLQSSGPALVSAGRALDALSRQPGVDAGARAQAAAAVRRLQASAALAAHAAARTPKVTGRQPVTLGVTEPFVTTVTVAGYAALLISLPFILWQLYAFVLPAFNAEERRVALPLMALIPVLFCAGVAFAYFVALPRAVDFLQNFNDQAFDILIQARDYYRFSVIVLAMTGLLFQIPVGVLAIVRLGVVSTAHLRKIRGYVIVGLAIVAAVVTPTPDPVTMLVTMAPMVVLYELSILLARAFEPKQSRWALDWDRDDDDEHELD